MAVISLGDIPAVSKPFEFLPAIPFLHSQLMIGVHMTIPRIALLVAIPLLLSSFQSQAQWVQVSNGLVDSTLHISDEIIVSFNTDCVNARSIPSLTGSIIYKCEPAGTAGTIMAGPSPDVNGSSSITFWQVYYWDGVIGWSAGKSLVKSPNVDYVVLCGTNLFASTEPSGEFRSTNNGASWTPVNLGLPHEFEDTTSGSVWTGVAEIGSHLFVGTSQGVFRSTNNGDSWTQAGLANSDVYALAVSGTNLFAGNVINDPGYGGVALTTNGGDSWTFAGLGLSAVYSFAVSGVNLFAGTERDGVARSSDSGLNWTAINNGLPQEDLFVGPVAFSGRNLFANVIRWESPTPQTYRSTDNGTNWIKVDTVGFGSIAVVDSNHCFGAFGGKVFLSTDSGIRWTAINPMLPDVTAGSLVISGTNLFAGTRSGVWMIPISKVLPIQLASFKASTVSGEVILTWTTVSETNNYGFYVQRNGVDIAFISGHGTTLQEHSYSYTDNPSPGQHEYRLKQVDLNGTVAFSESITSESYTNGATAPTRFALNQNYPNPFNPSTRISFSITKEGPVTLHIYDILGREVTTLVNENRKAGQYTEQFNGNQTASGVYMYVLKSSEGQLVRRMILLK
jgi:hypothetical protein